MSSISTPKNRKRTLKRKSSSASFKHKADFKKWDSPPDHEAITESAIPLLEPNLKHIQFDSFRDMAHGFDAVIKEFYRHYKKVNHENPSMFGFVSVTHEVKFIDTESMRTENEIGQKTTVIYAPLIMGEDPDERRNREIKILAAFDTTKRSSHIMALSLLMSLLGKKGLVRLMEKQIHREA